MLLALFADAQAPEALTDALRSWLENPLDAPLFMRKSEALERLGLEELKDLLKNECENRMNGMTEEIDG